MAYPGLWTEVKARVDWNGGGHWANWRSQVGPHVRAIWHTLSNEQKMAIASDAHDRALEIDTVASERMRGA